jgi:ligand-binding sensor domain-containing protein/AraC-like DNA-binding protein
MKASKIHLGILFILTSLLPSYGSNSLIKNLNFETGLSSNFIRTIYKDSNGLIWIGTDTGLDSYDGLQVVNYGKRFKTPLKGAVQSILESHNGIFWVGNEQGAFLYNKNGNYIAFVNFNKPTINVRKIFRSIDKKIYFATDRGLYLLDSLSFKANKIKLKKNVNEPPSLTGIAEDAQHRLWISSLEGLFCYNPANKQRDLYRINTIYEANTIRSITNLRNEELALGSESGAYTFNTETKKFVPIPGTEGKFILSLDCNHKHLFIGTEGDGVLVKDLESNSIQIIENNNVPVFSILYDKNGLLWTGTFSEGVNYYNLLTSRKFNTINLAKTQKIDVRSLYFTPDGDALVGSRNGFYIFNTDFKIKQEFAPFKTRGIRSRVITTICPYHQNKNLFLIGTFGGGASIFDQQSNKFYDLSDNPVFQNGSIYKFAPDNNNNIWIATLTGLFKYNIKDKSLKEYDLSKVIGNNELFDLNIDQCNRLWIATRVGACFYSLKNNNFVIPNSCKPYQYQCSSIFTDKSNNIWLCFNKGGVLKLDNKLQQKQWITTEIGLPENAPSSLIEDKSNNIWIGTQKGLYRVGKTGEIHAYGYEDGLTGLIFCPNSAVKDPKGNIWWANDKGLVNFNYAFNAENKSIPEITFTDLYINGSRFSADTLSFVRKNADGNFNILIKGRTKNNLELRFAALNYHNTKMNRYSYFIDGIDEKWSKPTENNIVSYKELPIGKHTLKILASNNDGVWTTQPLEVEIEISPYFYETNLFIIFIIILMTSVTFYYTRSHFVSAIERIKKQIDESINKQSPAHQTLKISEGKSTEIKSSLVKYMIEEKPFLNQELKQADVAAVLNFSVHEISQVLNSQMQLNFSDFVNSYRIEEVKERVATGKYRKYTVSAIAEQCGFNSKTTFYRAFKKSMGVSPSEYFKDMHE